MNVLFSNAEITTAQMEHIHDSENLIHHNGILIWLDSNIDESQKDCSNSISKLRHIITKINTFIDRDRCIQFLRQIREENIFVIVSGALGQQVVSTIHGIPQIKAIFVFCGNKSRHEQWAKDWPKIKGVFTNINDICEHLRQTIQKCDQELIPISFVETSGSSSQNLNKLDTTLMHATILKEILLQIHFKDEDIKKFTTYCREVFAENVGELNNIRELEQNYHNHTPIWWYTCECFLYPMLNRALRMLDLNIIIKMGFLIADLYRHIALLHSEQFDDHHHQQSLLTTYRGQGLSKPDFEQLMKTKGGFLGFNNFLSTSPNRKSSLKFVHLSVLDPDLVGILFKITVDPSISSTPFAYIGDASYYKDNEEILFAMSTVFRINNIQQMDDHNRLWEVNMTLTSDDDPEKRVLTAYMQEQIEESTGWDRLGRCFLKSGDFHNAEQLYQILLEQAADDRTKAIVYHQLGLVKYGEGEYKEARKFYKTALVIRQKTLPFNHPDLAESYSNIGSTYYKMGEYSKAHSFNERAVVIAQQSLPSNHPNLQKWKKNLEDLKKKL